MQLESERDELKSALEATEIALKQLGLVSAWLK